MKITLRPEPATKCRCITTHEGKFISLHDMVQQLARDGVVDDALSLLKVGHESGDNPRRVMAIVIGGFLRACAGDDE